MAGLSLELTEGVGRVPIFAKNHCRFLRERKGALKCYLPCSLSFFSQP